jgi:hypothetical protein
MFELAALSKLTALTHLDFSGTPMMLGSNNGQILQHLIPLQQLCQLELNRCLTAGGSDTAATVAQLTQLTSINLADNPLGLDVIAALGSCSNLVSGLGAMELCRLCG